MRKEHSRRKHLGGARWCRSHGAAAGARVLAPAAALPCDEAGLFVLERHTTSAPVSGETMLDRTPAYILDSQSEPQGSCSTPATHSDDGSPRRVFRKASAAWSIA